MEILSFFYGRGGADDFWPIVWAIGERDSTETDEPGYVFGAQSL
jgi:hypothetical protein